MTHAQFRQRLERLERPLQSPTIVEVSLIGQDEPEPPHAPNVEVMQITLDTPCEKADEAR
jgi:hypothetical protein